MMIFFFTPKKNILRKQCVKQQFRNDNWRASMVWWFNIYLLLIKSTYFRTLSLEFEKKKMRCP
jgi:hypothetical protein